MTMVVMEKKKDDREEAAPPPATVSAPHVQYRWCEACGKLRIMPPGDVPCTGASTCASAESLGLPAFEGVHVFREFVTADEEQALLSQMDEWPWKLSQSGRWKQDFGPKVNFKRKKVKVGNFTGLPSSSRDLVARMQALPCLQDFEPVEQCHLDYRPERGAAIDMHFDDDWIWGERLVTVNLLSETRLSFEHPQHEGAQVYVVLPARSLVAVQGSARTQWKHAVHRGAITDRRIAVTLRELGPDFVAGAGRAEEGRHLLDIAHTFKGTPLP
ncbi:hypothetical protein PTSG_09879 [Salpingoeca rosetta]|uniref:Fe2OG dioxygenase domain-containing protein n=1 Tax=Salpingoeca rosetta (strain ATCC 50818 / BSB-021) TaxID=946362 RepID=F2UNE2_SALR5|nr:uncharacterized protein PTSG_09879 [Salpingoeca rosetta]EGD79147.1 hypothetical protein PTSG_09879 [Salpingoeca rosetta]|eukprot:XP_004989232.1 hypothetical protein PTSG_09879 [Salpingoeca rosetta]